MSFLSNLDFINQIFMLLAVALLAISSFVSRKISEQTQKTVKDRIYQYTVELDNINENSSVSGAKNSTITYTPYIKSKVEAALDVNEEVMNIHQKQALIHSRVQFYTGIIMSILGFAFFVYILFLSLDGSNNIALGIKLTSSLIFEAIAVLFLKESHKLRESSKEYHDNLRENLKQQEAIKIAGAIQNEEIRSIIQAQLALHMIGIKSETIDITKILDSNNKVS
ncbi:hypothetical protein [Bacillus cereus]|uniref:hypothetical protein n=1 Tax=Bacillus cereus TaxID=1396 RepID=UPI000BF3AB00|nr:hypothetical protein [Bacillus cereus]PFA65898.1 hypothetical protein CN403_27640 [Bacillus cereus]PFL51880.1 hypothetical protein COJ34_06230 [Bacillus cereus]PFQ93780.1 hypothetical protein COK32_24885 [Bacillus cereus]